MHPRASGRYLWSTEDNRVLGLPEVYPVSYLSVYRASWSHAEWSAVADAVRATHTLLKAYGWKGSIGSWYLPKLPVIVHRGGLTRVISDPTTQSWHLFNRGHITLQPHAESTYRGCEPVLYYRASGIKLLVAPVETIDVLTSVISVAVLDSVFVPCSVPLVGGWPEYGGCSSAAQARQTRNQSRRDARTMQVSK